METPVKNQQDLATVVSWLLARSGVATYSHEGGPKSEKKWEPQVKEQPVKQKH